MTVHIIKSVGHFEIISKSWLAVPMLPKTRTTRFRCMRIAHIVFGVALLLRCVRIWFGRQNPRNLGEKKIAALPCCYLGIVFVDYLF